MFELIAILLAIAFFLLGIVFAFAYWATSSTFIGCQKTKGDNDESTVSKS